MVDSEKPPLFPSQTEIQSTSSTAYHHNGPAHRFVSEESQDIRMAFVRKVYSLLLLQLFITAVVSFLMYFTPSVRRFVHTYIWPMWMNLGIMIALSFLCYWKRRSYPLNLIFLTIFTLAMSYFVGAIVTLYESYIVVQAILLTLLLVLSLTFYTIFSKRDFSGLGPFLIIFGTVIFCAVLFQIFIHYVFHYNSPTVNIVYSAIIAFFYCLYLVYNTYRIFNRISVEEYIMAVIMLYTDIIHIFIAVLRILGNLQRRGN